MLENQVEIEEIEILTAEDYQKQSEINDLRQHANKIIHGIKKLDKNDVNRAIWELFQNAVDLSPESHVQVDITNENLQFSHNGEPFTPMTLDCLFKQVSSKTLGEKKEVYEDTDPLGQYGTGFMTSHVFGMELEIDGGIRKGDGYIPLKNFGIDRRTDNWKILAGAIRDLKGEVSALLGQHQSFLPKPFPRTRFTYKFSNDQNRNAAKKAIDSLRLILPYVMALNPNLKTVEVNQDGQRTSYKKNEVYSKGELFVRPIEINGANQEICYLEALDGKVMIILPIDENLEAIQFDTNLPRLFLFYPLIGTENFGFNFIINSRQFQPTEPRDGLFLSSDNSANAKDEARNQNLIQIGSTRIFEFLKANAGQILNPSVLATVNFNITSEDRFLNTYFTELKKQWIDNLKSLPLVETSDGNIPITEAYFLHQDLLENEESFNAAHTLANKFWKNIPKKDLITRWTGTVDEWAIDEIKYITAKDIAIKVEETGKLSEFENIDVLKDFYKFIITSENFNLFNLHRLLPNIKGDFRFLSGNEGLNNPVNIDDELIKIADVIMAEIPKRHVHDDFKFSLEFPDYSRKNFTTEVLEAIAKQVSDKTLSSDLAPEFMEKFLDFCKLTTVEDSSSVPARMVKRLAKHYGKEEKMILISNVKDDELEIRSAHRRLVRMTLNDLSLIDSKWVEDHLNFLLDFISIGSAHDTFEEMFQTLPVFPNQVFELTKQSFLNIDGQIPDEIKNLYDEVLKPNYPIRANLVHEDFKPYLKNPQIKVTRDLTQKIESAFFPEDSNFNINEHSYKKEILAIIDEIKHNYEYAKHYPLINSKRSSILVDLADGEDTFSILSLNATRIKALAKLGVDPFFDQIIQLGRKALITEHQEHANFQYKHAIGTHIESILREGLKNILKGHIKADILNVQDGQDIVIKIDEKPVYYIEVKSRWDANSSVKMSKNQTIKADEKKDRYALCAVDMTKYTGEKPLEVQTIPEIESCMWFNTDIGYEVSHLIDVINQEKDMDSIHLDGDFRTLVPMNYIESGIRLKQFETDLINLLKAAEKGSMS